MPTNPSEGLPEEPGQLPYVDDGTDWQPSVPPFGGGGHQPYQPFGASPAVSSPPPAVASAPREAVQWLVKVNDNGRPQELGRIDVRASIADIIDRWFDALAEGGTVQLFPVDMMGAMVQGYEHDPKVLDISPAHEAIAKIKRRRSMGVGQAGIGGGFGAQGLDIDALLQRQATQHTAEMTLMREEIREMRLERKAERDDLVDQKAKLADQHVALAVTSNQQTAEQMQKVQDTMQTQHASQIETVITLFTQQQQSATLRHDQMMERVRTEASLERERRDESRKAEDARERARRDEEREWRDRAEKREAGDRKARQTQDSAAHERELNSTRDHQAMTLKLIEARSEVNDLGKQVMKMMPMITTAAAALGIDLKDGGLQTLIQKIAGGGQGGILETIGDVAKTVAQTAVELKKLESGDDDEDPNEIVIVQQPDGTQVQVTRGQLAQFQQQMIAVQQQAQIAQTAQTAGDAAQVEVTGDGRPAQDSTELPGFTAWGQPGDPGVPHVAPPLPQPGAQQAQQAPAQTPISANPAAALLPQLQKAGRQATRAVVEAVAKTPSPQRGDVLMQHIMDDLANLGPYMQAVGVTYAIREAGADEALTGEIVALVQASQMLPESIPL